MYKNSARHRVVYLNSADVKAPLFLRDSTSQTIYFGSAKTVNHSRRTIADRIVGISTDANLVLEHMARAVESRRDSDVK